MLKYQCDLCVCNFDKLEPQKYTKVYTPVDKSNN